MQSKDIAVWLVLTVLCCYSCRNQQPAQIEKKQLELLPAGLAWGALWQQRSGEYDALCFQAYNLARLRLDELTKQKSGKPFAIITDIDETVLDNSPYFARQAAKGEVYQDSSWMEWTAEEACDTVPGAASFLKYAASRGVSVFYITNRFQAEQKQTLNNLRKWDLPNADSLHLFLLNTSNSSKETRRKAVLDKYKVLLLLGDNLGDFSKVFEDMDLEQRREIVQKEKQDFGSRFIVLPNAMYGSWESAMQEGHPHSTVSEINAAYLKTLKK